MPTKHQELGAFGETLVADLCRCPRCKPEKKTFKRLPPNFKCADLICDFCGFLAQVKASTAADIDTMPKAIMGAAWEPQKARMDAAIYFPLYVVLATTDKKQSSVWYLSADLQPKSLFKQREPLSPTAKRAGWQGFMYDIDAVASCFVRLV